VTGVYLIGTSAATLIVSYVSGSIIQLTAWHRLWDSLLRGIGGPSGGTLQIGHSVDELLAHNFPPTRWMVPGYFPEGLAMLADRPKIGKSWLALQRVHAISSGGPIFNESIEPAPVLYIAFEEAARRLKKRMKAQAWPGLYQGHILYRVAAAGPGWPRATAARHGGGPISAGRHRPSQPRATPPLTKGLAGP
jgi:hypothetical protein